MKTQITLHIYKLVLPISLVHEMVLLPGIQFWGLDSLQNSNNVSQSEPALMDVSGLSQWIWLVVLPVSAALIGCLLIGASAGLIMVHSGYSADSGYPINPTHYARNHNSARPRLKRHIKDGRDRPITLIAGIKYHPNCMSDSVHLYMIYCVHSICVRHLIMARLNTRIVY